MRIAAILLLLSTGCGSDTGIIEPSPMPSPDPMAWRQDRTDLLNYFLGHRPDGMQPHSPGDRGHWLALGWESGRSFYLKVATPRNGELHRWDDNFVYLVEDGQAGLKSYSFSNGRWIPRRGKAGDRIESPNNLITWFDSSCNAQPPRAWPIAITIDSIGPYDFGGALGVQDTLWLTYWWPTKTMDRLDPAERFAYTWEWGWVAWQGMVDKLPVYVFNDPRPHPTPTVEGFCK